ncbi:type IV secretion protein Rhs [Niveispirillum lacus]|uniref:Type IV secretion protein Rhs n=1 Tax=Niveispirillum lacus TaxID=1981099 RepID=A0A255Z5N1_9PROT|nr:type VI secretion system tip protein VgrG [Niveispirillum lacus]OYQ36195.1 type IV secretion protein Rhs [Niveispirillum lacus]
MADDPDGGLASYTITVNGTAIPTEYQVSSIDIEQSVNRIARAAIMLPDGDASSQDFAVSSADTFVPGATISIQLGYDNTNKEVFSGIITGQRLSLTTGGHSTLEVECRDKAVLLTVGRKSSAYASSKDSDAISTILSNAGLTADVAATTVQQEALIQYDSTDWDFIVTRAEINGFLVLTLNGTVKVFDPLNQTDPSVTITQGIDLFGFDGVLDAVGQVDEVSASAWDPATLKLINASANASFAGPGNLTTKKLAGDLGQGTLNLQTAGAETNDALTGWAKAQVAKSTLAKIVATATLQGRSDLTPGQTVALAGLGGRFNGTHLITGIRHRLREGNWTCDLLLGHERQWFVQEHDVSTPAAAGLLPAISGLFCGTVLKIDSDPGNGFRIQVEIALFNDNNAGIWARMAHFHATDGAGAFFLPEVGDEVLVGFLNADPRFPVILGSLYSKDRKPNSALTPDSKNSHKAVYTKAGSFLDFNDEDKIITLSTPGGNKLVLDDKNGQIQLVDQNGNSLQMDSSAIALKSAAALNAQAATTMSLKGDNGITAESSGGDVSAKGTNLSLTANAQLTAKGSASAEIQGGAQLTLKGGMVMIN